MKVRNIDPIIIRGGGDIATGSIYMLHKAGYPVIVLETSHPSAIRREVAFSDAVYHGSKKVEDETCYLYNSFNEAYDASLKGEIALIVDPDARCLDEYKPRVLVDGILAKKNLGTKKDMADVVIALGPGFEAGYDCDFVIETMRGHTLGRIIEKGSAIPNTATPGIIAGVGKERVIHSPAEGTWHIIHDISDIVTKGDTIATITSQNGQCIDVKATISGVIRGTLREGFPVTIGFKAADIDPRITEVDNCFLISDKARTIAGSVLQIVSTVTCCFDNKNS